MTLRCLGVQRGRLPADRPQAALHGRGLRDVLRRQPPLALPADPAAAARAQEGQGAARLHRGLRHRKQEHRRRVSRQAGASHLQSVSRDLCTGSTIDLSPET